MLTLSHAAAPARDKAKQGTLYEAEDWTEIEAYLFGPDSPYKPEALQVMSAAIPQVTPVPLGTTFMHVWMNLKRSCGSLLQCHCAEVAASDV